MTPYVSPLTRNRDFEVQKRKNQQNFLSKKQKDYSQLAIIPSKFLVPRDRIELPTQGFSVPRSTY